MGVRSLTMVQRTLIRELLKNHEVRSVVALMNNTISETPVTYSAVDVIRAGMVKRGELLPRAGWIDGHKGLDPDDPGLPVSGETSFDARMGSQRLLERQLATGQYFSDLRSRWLEKHQPMGIAA